MRLTPAQSKSPSTVVATSPMPVDNGKSKSSTLAKLGAGAASGVCEVALFHPVDTCAKRLMTNKEPIKSAANLSKALFKDAAHLPTWKRAASLFPGLKFATGYKVTQRAYKFGTQPIIKDALENQYGNQFKSTFGDNNSRIMLNATAGSICGLGEVALLPLDALKVKSQTNPEDLKGRGAVAILRQEGIRKLYRGAGWTAARNVPGSFALFGGNTAVQMAMRSGKEDTKPTLLQHAAGSMGGAAASIISTNPLDVVKTRMQQASFAEKPSGVLIVKDIIRNEGAGAFLKGLGPKLLAAGPKVAFAMTIAQQLHQKFQAMLNREE